MTLHLDQLVHDIEQMGQQAGGAAYATWLAAARALLSDYDPDRLREKLAYTPPHDTLLVGEPLEPLDTQIPAPLAPPTYTVAAADGSNIAPDRDSHSYYYVLNTGLVRLDYGDSPNAEITARAQLFYRPDDLYWDAKRQFPIDSQRISLLMRVEEIAALPELVRNVHQPCVVMVDGPLILWDLHNQKANRWQLIERLMDAFDILQDQGIPIVGYISNSSSFELRDLLRLYLCPTHPSLCQVCPLHRDEGQGLCHALNGVRDAAVLFPFLETGERGAAFESRATILEAYVKVNKMHRIVYYYFNTGDEIARVEMPTWVWQDVELRDLVQAVIQDQCERSGTLPPYPPVLHEAHEAAVITMGDRANVELLVEQQLHRHGLSTAFRPAKSFHKRLRGV